MTAWKPLVIHLGHPTIGGRNTYCGNQPCCDRTLLRPRTDSADPFGDAVTCPGCRARMDAIKREHCNATDPDPAVAPLGVQCVSKPGHDGLHSWERVEPLYGILGGTLEAIADMEADRLPVRVPGAALAEAQDAWEDEGGTPEPREAARGPETNLARRVIGRWSA